ncbi:uncharacterized protein PHACADRAFT_199762 [Phanerochaete carnosa HHB-10118-sp]|uniref:Alpha/beta hydrolase fold-3 domain-containing protein n=1 Tax=Phanerochaete carnosa (strain HHB-10118-sp) TaxID=650164 RepID=K5WKY3_PHACS|nr:uncharacterized protein PHACADRAFT_199762 [Phanerochaete carnosa HHB-10118-sp]EKM50922.1 hypothetical protein PHACADRAFT_199762 [Phanerochaete carnosa HHB-10118-sp]
MFAFRSQPLKALYLLVFVPFTLFVRLPYWVLVSTIPAFRPRKTWSMKRALSLYIVTTNNNLTYTTGFSALPGNPEKESAKPETTGFAWVDAVPDDLVTGELAEFARRNQVAPARIYGYWYGARGEHGKPGQHAGKNERVIYFIHGGGHVMGSAHPSNVWRGIPDGFVSYCATVAKRVFSLEYRLSSSAPYKPENPFPASMLDALSGYRYLIETLGFETQNIILVGDSGGAQTASNLVRYLISARLPGLVPPSALVLLSPAMDWGNTHLGTPAPTMDTNIATDFLRPVMLNGYSATSMRGSLDAGELETNPWLSPASLKLARTDGLWANFPPTAIVAGDAEHMVDSMRTLRDRLVHDNGKDRVTYFEYPDVFHDWVLLPWIEPERSQAFNDLRKWLEGVYGM